MILNPLSAEKSYIGSFASVAYLEHANASSYVSSTKRGVRFAFVHGHGNTFNVTASALNNGDSFAYMTNYGRIYDLSAGRISSTGIRFVRVSIDGHAAGHFCQLFVWHSPLYESTSGYSRFYSSQ